MKYLNGAELASYVKVRQAKQVRALRQAHKVFPKLAILQTTDDPVIDRYVSLKQRYGDDILVETVVYKVEQEELPSLIGQLNEDETVHGIIVQLPLARPAETERIVNLVAAEKDVDGLGSRPSFDPATPMAINWLLTGYNVELRNRKLVIVGHGRLVGAPLAKMWRNSGLDPEVLDEDSGDIADTIRSADVVVTATGVPGLITSDMLRPDTVVVDAGTSSEAGEIVGDVAQDVRARHDLVMTPEKGGVGPLTICALFDNVIRAAQAQSEPSPRPDEALGQP